MKPETTQVEVTSLNMRVLCKKSCFKKLQNELSLIKTINFINWNTTLSTHIVCFVDGSVVVFCSCVSPLMSCLRTAVLVVLWTCHPCFILPHAVLLITSQNETNSKSENRIVILWNNVLFNQCHMRVVLKRSWQFDHGSWTDVSHRCLDNTIIGSGIHMFKSRYRYIHVCGHASVTVFTYFCP